MRPISLQRESSVSMRTGIAELRSTSPEYEYYTAWLSSVAAVAAISFWENGMFIRLSGSHPPAGLNDSIA